MSPLMPDSTPRILIIEPDEILARNLNIDLTDSGYEIIIAKNLEQGKEYATKIHPALIVIERVLGVESGLLLCRELRQIGDRVPVLILMARDTIEDRTACLEAGADDYLLKPYRPEDLLHRIRIYLQSSAPQTSEKLRFGELVLDLATRRAFRNGRTIDLTVKEYELLKYLMENPREVLTRDQILENVWGYDFVGESNVIEVYIRYLRLKIEEDGEKRLIQTVRGVGYVLREN